MHVFRKTGVFVCLSASLFVLGTYLCVIKVPVWVGNEFEPMHAYLPFGFLLGLLALLFFVYGIILELGKPQPIAQLRTIFPKVITILGVTFGVLTLTSTVLPWVIAERTTTLIETRVGTFNVAQYHALLGLNLMREINEIVLVLVGGTISVLTPFLCLLERERPKAVGAFLFLLSGLCIIGPITLVHGRRIWWINLGELDNSQVFGQVIFKSPGVGILIAIMSAIALITSGLIISIKLTRRLP